MIAQQSSSSRIKQFALLAVVVTVCFAIPLYKLCNYALHDEFFSYIPLIPFITGYLIWIKRAEFPKKAGASGLAAIGAALGGAGFLAAGLWAAHSDRLHLQDFLTLIVSSYMLILLAGALALFGWSYLRTIAFPIAFLAFMIPLPSPAQEWMEAFFQQTSAVAASGFLTVAGMPVFRENLLLHLPGFSLLVAPECSGIHSTMVLFMTSLLASHLFLHSRWRQGLLVAFIVPLAILRNGFRIFVIAELCVRVSHDMINSPIHRRGGPLFFALSLIPFFALLIYLKKSEARKIKISGGSRKS